MSVTFYIPDARTTLTMIPCTYGAGESWACSPEERCGHCADGLEECIESEAPEIVMSQVTGGVILRALGLYSVELYGFLAVKDIPQVRRQIVRLLNLGGYETYPTESLGKHHLAGVSDERIQHWLKELDLVLAAGQTMGHRVSWG